MVILQDGKLISMATGLPYDGDAPATYKRAIALDEDELDEGVERSMARRKKNAPPMDINKKCSHCEKIFKRPCDLTKHEKTHSRPWKCTDTTCKYNQIGWPTEKERDRHMNDKHSDSPNTFNCHFKPCPYSSKRESNCKQHMEKAHGWVYVRSKHSSRVLGAKSKRGTSIHAASVQATFDTPGVSTPASGPTDFSTPSVGPTPSPFTASIDEDEDCPINFAALPDQPPAMCNPNFQVMGVPGYSNVYDNSVYDNSIGVSHSAGVVSPGINQPTGYDNTAGYDLFTENDNSVDYTNSTGHGNFSGFDGSVNSPHGFTHSVHQGSAANMTNDQAFAYFDSSLASLQAQFAAADQESLIPSILSEPVPDLAETGSMSGSMSGTLSLAPSPQATGEISSANLDIDWSSLGSMDNMAMANDTEAMFQVQCGNYGHVSGLSPVAQGDLMLYSPESGLSGGNISRDFPFGVSMAPQPDFTLYEGNGEGFATGQLQGPFVDYD